MADTKDGSAVDPSKDYSGQGTGTEIIDTIENEEELQRYLKNSGAQGIGNDPDKDSDEPDDDQLTDEERAAKTKKPGKPAKSASASKITDPMHPDFKLPDSLQDEEEEDEEEYGNMVEYLNKEFDLGLNTTALPKDMTREQEAEAIGSVFRRINEGVQAKLAQYQDIEGLLEDEEVAALLEAKRNGKGLKDIASAYTGVSDGAPDDVVVSRHLKQMYPTLTEAEIQDQIKSYKDSKRMDKMASAARDYFKAEDTKKAQLQEAQRKQEEQQAEIEYRQSVAKFGQFLQKTEKLYDVPITPDIKKAIFQAVTVRDREGMTAHERALQSDAGTFLSALGMFYMKKMLQNGSSLKANKKLRDFKDSLFDTPDKLQGGSEAETEPDFNASLANRF